jgi:hypothetical protein
LVFGQVLSYLPDFDSLDIRFSDGTWASFRLLGQFADLSTSPYYSVPVLRKSTTLSLYLHTNDAFNAFISHEENVDTKKPSLWKSAAAAAAVPAFNARRFQSSNVGERWRMLSKKHKALLDPIDNLKRDHILNIPLPADNEDDVVGLEGPVRPPFADAETLARVIKDTLSSSSPPSSPLTGRSPNSIRSQRTTQAPSSSSTSSTTGAPNNAVSSEAPGSVPSNQRSGPVSSNIASSTIASTVISGAPPSFAEMGGMSYAISGDTVIIKIPSFVPEPKFSGDENFYFFPEFIEIQKIARQSRKSRLLIDLTDNGGGYVMSAYAMLWYLLSDPSRICAPLHKRITPNWSLWIESFGDGIPAIVSRYLGPQGDALADKLDDIFKEITSVIKVLFDGLGLTVDQRGSMTKDVALARVNAKKAQIANLGNRSAKANAIRDYLLTVAYIPDELPAKSVLLQSYGFAPFDPYEMTVPDTRGRPFSPLLSNFKRLIRKNWGPSGTSVSQLGEFAFCYEVMTHMPAITAQSGGSYTRNYWTQVGIVTDGTCGSACSLFSTLMVTNGDAVAFTYGGQADTAMDISSFCGGNVLEYNDVMQSTALARKIASLSSQRLSPYDIAHRDTFVDSFIAMPTKATARLNWNMAMMETHMSRSLNGMQGEVYTFDPLPRQMYLVPARKHINRWAPDDVSRADVYADVIAIANWATIPAQFRSSHGQCPKEAAPFTYMTTSRFF